MFDVICAENHLRPTAVALVTKCSKGKDREQQRETETMLVFANCIAVIAVFTDTVHGVSTMLTVKQEALHRSSLDHR